MIDKNELTQFQLLVFEDDPETYDKYLSSKILYLKEKILEDILSDYLEKRLTEESILKYIETADSKCIKACTKIYKYEKDLNIKKCIILLKERFFKEQDIVMKEQIFQSIRMISHEVEFDFVLDHLNESYLALIVGEIARKKEIDSTFLHSVKNNISLIFLGYTHIGRTSLNDFDVIFDETIIKNAEIIELLDFENGKIKNAILRNKNCENLIVYIAEKKLNIPKDLLISLLPEIKNLSFKTNIIFFENYIFKFKETEIFDQLKDFESEKIINLAFIKTSNEIFKRQIFKIFAMILESEFERLSTNDNFFDFLCMIIYHQPNLKISDKLKYIKNLEERELLEKAETLEKVEAKLDILTGMIERENFTSSLYDEKEIEKKISFFIEERESNEVNTIKNRLNFIKFIYEIQRISYYQLTKLPREYFLLTVKIFSNPYFNLLSNFLSFNIPNDRRKLIIVKEIEKMGCMSLLINYMLNLDDYYNVKLDYAEYKSMMSKNFKMLYFIDNPMLILKNWAEIKEEIGERIEMLKAPLKSLKNVEGADLSLIDECISDINQILNDNKSKKFEEVHEKRFKIDSVSEENIKNLKFKICNKEPEIKKQVFVKKEVLNSIRFLEAIVDENIILNEEEKNKYSDKVALICSGVSTVIEKKHDVQRAAAVISELIKSGKSMDTLIEYTMGLNIQGRKFEMLVKFYIYFLINTQIEILDSQHLHKFLLMAKKFSGSDILYFIFVRIEPNAINKYFELFIKDHKLISQALQDRLGNDSTVNIPVELKYDKVFMKKQTEDTSKILNTIKAFIDSKNEYKNLCALKIYKTMGICNAEVLKFMTSSDDELVEAALSIQKPEFINKETNDSLLELLFKRGKLDALGIRALRTINIDILEQDDIERIYQLFFIDPLNYLEILPKFLDRGYEISNEMLSEILKLCATGIHKEEIYKILKFCAFEEHHFYESIDQLSEYSHKCKMIILQKMVLYNLKFSLPYFIKFSVCIANEENYEALKLMLTVIKMNNKDKLSITEKWKVNNNLDGLMLRIYPLYFKDKKYYVELFKLYTKTKNYECKFLADFYKDEFDGIFNLSNE